MKKSQRLLMTSFECKVVFLKPSYQIYFFFFFVAGSDFDSSIEF